MHFKLYKFPLKIFSNNAASIDSNKKELRYIFEIFMHHIFKRNIKHN